MNQNLTIWLASGSALLSFVFYLAALVYVATRPSDGSRAKFLATTGIAMLCALQVIVIVVRVFGSQVIPVDQIPLFFGVVSIVHNLLHLASLSCLIAAAFTSRNPKDHDGPERYPQPSNNPYSPPVN